MFYACTFSELKQQLNPVSISRALVEKLKNLNFFGVGKTTEIVVIQEDGSIDEEEGSIEVVELTPDVRQQFTKILDAEIVLEATKIFSHAKDNVGVDPACLLTLRTLVELKQSIEDKMAKYISFSD